MQEEAETIHSHFFSPSIIDRSLSLSLVATDSYSTASPICPFSLPFAGLPLSNSLCMPVRSNKIDISHRTRLASKFPTTHNTHTASDHTHLHRTSTYIIRHSCLVDINPPLLQWHTLNALFSELTVGC